MRPWLQSRRRIRAGSGDHLAECCIFGRGRCDAPRKLPGNDGPVASRDPPSRERGRQTAARSDSVPGVANGGRTVRIGPSAGTPARQHRTPNRAKDGCCTFAFLRGHPAQAVGPIEQRCKRATHDLPLPTTILAGPQPRTKSRDSARDFARGKDCTDPGRVGSRGTAADRDARVATRGNSGANPACAPHVWRDLAGAAGARHVRPACLRAVQHRAAVRTSGSA